MLGTIRLVTNRNTWICCKDNCQLDTICPLFRRYMSQTMIAHHLRCRSRLYYSCSYVFVSNSLPFHWSVFWSCGKFLPNIRQWLLFSSRDPCSYIFAQGRLDSRALRALTLRWTGQRDKAVTALCFREATVTPGDAKCQRFWPKTETNSHSKRTIPPRACRHSACVTVAVPAKAAMTESCGEGNERCASMLPRAKRPRMLAGRS